MADLDKYLRRDMPNYSLSPEETVSLAITYTV